MSMNNLRTTGVALMVALMAGLLGSMAAPAAEASTGSLLYSCSGPGFGTEPSYAFRAVVDSDFPATVPYGSARVTSWTTQLVAPDSFRSWAVSRGFTTLYAGARLGTSLDGVAQLQNYQSSAALGVPATPGPWTWTINPTTTIVVTSALGHHTFTLASLEVTVAFYDADGPAWATTGTCTLDPAVPVTDTVVDAYDVVAATTTTGLVVKGDTATATVTSNGTAPAGTVTFSVGGKSVTTGIVGGSVPGVVSGTATAKLPSVPPGAYTVSAQFAPTDASQLTASTGTASYVAPPMATKSLASARYKPALALVKARARVTTPDGTSVSGRVAFTLKRNGKTVQNTTVRLSSKSVATKKFRDIRPSGRYLVVAKYLGTSTFEPSTDRLRFTLP